MKNNIVDLKTNVSNVLGQIYQDLAQPGVKAVGEALGTVLEFSTLPILWVKLLNEKAKANFKKRLNEYKDKLEQVPEEKLCEIHPEIGVPIIENLLYTTNDEIADLFTTLLANASNMDMVHTAHPAFAHILARLSPDEARIIIYLKEHINISYCNVYVKDPDSNAQNRIENHLTLIPQEVDLNFPENTNAYLSNLVCVGILLDMNTRFLVDNTEYNRIATINDFEKIKSLHSL